MSRSFRIRTSLLKSVNDLIQSNYTHKIENCELLIEFILRYLKHCILSGKVDQQSQLDYVYNFLRFIKTALKECKDCENYFEQFQGLDTLLLLCDCEWSFLFAYPSPTLLNSQLSNKSIEIHSSVQNTSQVIIHINGTCFNDVIIESGAIWPDPTGYTNETGNQISGKITSVESYDRIIILDDNPSKKSLNDYNLHILSKIDTCCLKPLLSPPVLGNLILHLDSKGPARAVTIRIDGESLYVWFVDYGVTGSVKLSNCYDLTNKFLNFPTISRMYRLCGVSITPMRSEIIECCLDCLSLCSNNECIGDFRFINNYLAVIDHSSKPTPFLQSFGRLVVSLYDNYSDNTKIKDLFDELNSVVDKRFGHQLRDFASYVITPQHSRPASQIRTLDFAALCSSLELAIDKTIYLHQSTMCESVMNLYLRYIKLFIIHRKPMKLEYISSIMDYIAGNLENCTTCKDSFSKFGGVDVFECLMLPNNACIFDTSCSKLADKLNIGTIYNARVSSDDVIDIFSPSDVKLCEMLVTGDTHWCISEAGRCNVTTLSVRLLKVISSTVILCELQDGRATDLDTMLAEVQSLQRPKHANLESIYLQGNDKYSRVWIVEYCSEEVKVYKIDEGDYESVPLSSLFECSSDLKEHPPLATECRIYGVHSRPHSCELLSCLVRCVGIIADLFEWSAGPLHRFAELLFSNFTGNVNNLGVSFMPILRLLIKEMQQLECRSIINMFPSIKKFVCACGDDSVKAEISDCVTAACEGQIEDVAIKNMIISTIKRICVRSLPSMKTNEDVQSKSRGPNVGESRSGVAVPKLGEPLPTRVDNVDRSKLSDFLGTNSLSENIQSLPLGNTTGLRNNGTTHLIDFEDVLAYDFSSLDSVFVSFLNSGRLCNIYFGVDSGGVVKGTNCNNRQRRDSYRLTVDRINGRIRPNLIQHCMTVRFIPVEGNSRYVVVVSIDARNLKILFCDLAYVYWKRTNSGECLKMNAHEIQNKTAGWIEQEILYEIAYLQCKLNH